MIPKDLRVRSFKSGAERRIFRSKRRIICISKFSIFRKVWYLESTSTQPELFLNQTEVFFAVRGCRNGWDEHQTLLSEQNPRSVRILLYCNKMQQILRYEHSKLFSGSRECAQRVRSVCFSRKSGPTCPRTLTNVETSRIWRCRLFLAWNLSQLRF